MTLTERAAGPRRARARTRPGQGLQRVPPWRRKLRPYLLSVPAVALIIGILIPFGSGLWYAFLNYAAGVTDVHWVGWDNFTAVFSGDSGVWPSVRVTLLYATLATVFETVLGVGIALLLNRATLVSRVLEKVLILPLMIAPVIAATVWKLMFNPSFGILNHVLGLGHDYNWLGKDNALYSALLVDVWIYTPFVAILVLAGIRSLPKEPFEASAVDGASPIYMFRRLMLPMIWPYILVAVIFRLMDSLKIFDTIYVLTSGGPGVATTTLQINAYEDSIQNLNYSRGATYMVVLWLIVFIVARLLVMLLAKAQRRAAGAED